MHLKSIIVRVQSKKIEKTCKITNWLHLQDQVEEENEQKKKVLGKLNSFSH